MTEEERRELGQRVEAARLARGWGKERAAREAEISAITWKRIEDGLTVQDAKLAKALAAVEIDLDDAEQGATVGAASEDDLLYRRPPGLSDAEWEHLKTTTREWIEWQLDRAAKER